LKKLKEMKNIICLLILTGLLAMTACEDFLNQTPSFALPAEETIKTIDDLQNAVNGAYSRLNAFDYYSGDFFPLGDLRADIMTANPQLDANQISPVSKYQYDKNSSYATNFWRAPYVTIGRINDVLGVAEKLVPQPGAEVRFKDLTGQLYALRALCHFDLARMFAQLPTALHDGITMDSPDSGIPIADRVFPVDYKPVRNTLSEVYNFILSDFDMAIGRLDPEASITTSYGYINIWAAKALKARVQLYLGNYSEALALSGDVINNAGPAGYRLAELTEYSLMWRNVSQPEYLFEVITTLLYNAQRNSLGYYADPEGYGEFAVTDEFAEWLLSLETDVRYTMVSYKQNSQGYGGGYYCNKYPGREESLYVNNAKVIRMSEVYLIASEAALKLADQTKADQYLNALRSKRLVVQDILTNITMNDILDERKKELFAEGQRSWDVWRNQGSLVNTNFSFDAVSYDNYRTLIAIPQRELDISPGLVQNPGWFLEK
jgi:hypothetical protein